MEKTLLSMEAHNKDEGRRHGLTASAVVIQGEGDGSGGAMAVTVSGSTPALVAVVLGLVIVGVMTWGLPRLQGAEVALVENGSDCLAAAA